MNEIHDTRKNKDHTRWRKLDLGRRSSGECEEVEFEVFSRETREFLPREIGDKEIEIALTLYIDKYAAWWIGKYWKVYRIKIS